MYLFEVVIYLPSPEFSGENSNFLYKKKFNQTRVTASVQDQVLGKK